MRDRLSGINNEPSQPEYTVKFCFVCYNEFETDDPEADAYCSSSCYAYDGGVVENDD